MRGPRVRDVLTATGAPPLALGVFVVYFVAIWLLGFRTLTAIHGSPSHVGGQYYLTNHGVRTPADRATYLHAQTLTQRAFALVPSAFFARGVPRVIAGD